MPHLRRHAHLHAGQQLICNQLDKQLPAQARRLMFSFAPAKWFAAWHVTRRRAVGMIRAIGLEFMERIRKSEGG